MGRGSSLGGVSMPPEVRQRRITDLLDRREFVRVRDLTAEFQVSAVTVRSDLDVLESQGKLHRVHGGAMRPGGAKVERSFDENERRRSPDIEAIGRAAAQLVEPGQAIIIDVGTTAAALARALVQRAELHDVTVFTNGLKIALALEPAAGRLAIVVTGGTLRPMQHSLVNPMASAPIGTLSVSTAFIGCNGVDIASGVTNLNLPEAEVKRSIVEAAERRVVLADASKLGRRSLAGICSIDEVDVLVTSANADADLLTDLRAHGIDVVVAASSP